MDWSWKKVLIFSGITVGGGALAILTCGAAAPAVGAMLGGALGLEAAAGAAGLAALGGGAIAAGGAGLAGGAAAGAMLGGTAGLSGSAASSTIGFAALGSRSATAGEIAIKFAGRAGSVGTSSIETPLSNTQHEFENLQTIASNLSHEIFDLKRTFETTPENNAKARAAIGQQIVAKEARLNVISDALKV